MMCGHHADRPRHTMGQRIGFSSAVCRGRRGNQQKEGDGHTHACVSLMGSHLRGGPVSDSALLLRSPRGEGARHQPESRPKGFLFLSFVFSPCLNGNFNECLFN